MAERMQGQMYENSRMFNFHSNAKVEVTCTEWTLKYSTSVLIVKLFSNSHTSSMVL